MKEQSIKKLAVLVQLFEPTFVDRETPKDKRSPILCKKYEIPLTHRLLAGLLSRKHHFELPDVEIFVHTKYSHAYDPAEEMLYVYGEIPVHVDMSKEEYEAVIKQLRNHGFKIPRKKNQVEAEEFCIPNSISTESS